ncbi:MAG TPA: response regulator [Rhizomicrobium sp.]|nr:response regulator [Rhizomicrobium sp.]
MKGISALVLDRDQFTRSLVSQMLRGFGLDTLGAFETGAQGMEYLQNNRVDLCIIEAMLPDMKSSELLSWLRKQERQMRFTPVIVLTGYTQLRMVAAARDGGANSVVKKPVSPRGLFDRINWVARVQRPFIDAGHYVGPDRRFRKEPPPDGRYKRETDEGTDVEVTNSSPETVNPLAQALSRG